MNTYDNSENEVQVMFEGGFGSGTFTLVSALTGINLTPLYTANIITKIVFNKDEKAVFYKNGNQKYEEKNIRDYLERCLDDKDVDYAVLQHPQSCTLGDIAQLIVLPPSVTNRYRYFDRNASAIVYVINAALAFYEEERRYIKDHFVISNAEPMKNLFFVVNRFDCVNASERSDLKKMVRKELNDVFLKADGSFDEELFSKRVFYTNAYKAECARKGFALENKDGDMVVPTYENTGVPELEKELIEFLNNEKIKRKKEKQMNTYAKKQELVDEVVLNLSDLSELLGAPDESKKEKYGFIPGLEVKVEEESILKQIQTLKDGIFQVLFTGGFSSGKSTLLNALMRKRLLRTGINPETAVISKIIFNADEKAIVYKKAIDENGNQKYEEMTIKKFFEKYSLDEGEEINYELFNDVEYVRLQQSQDGVGGSMVQLVDSPGTGHNEADDATAKTFAKNASAIVYVISAVQAFQEKENEYIKKHFVVSNAEPMKNLFFVVNRYDGVNASERSDLKKRVRKELNDVFLKADGSFDEELFSKRVFYTNAYKAECARANIAMENEDGDMIVPNEKNTGVPEFEKALNEFLLDERRDKDSLVSYVSKLENIYAAAKHTSEDTYKKSTQSLESLKAEAAQYERDVEAAENTLKNVKDLTFNTVRNIVLSSNVAYNDYVSNVDNGWEKYFEEHPVENLSITGIIWDKLRSKDMKERFAPITNGIETYLDDNYKTLEDNVNDIIDKEIKSWEESMKIYQSKLDSVQVDLDDILIRIVDVNGMKIEHNDVSMSKVILAALFNDPELVVDGVTGTGSMGDFIFKLIKTNIIDYIKATLLEIILGPAGLVLFCIDKIRKMKKQNTSNTMDILNETKHTTIKTLNENKQKFSNEFEFQLSNTLLKVTNDICLNIEKSFEETHEKNKDIIARREDQTLNVKEEKKRMDDNLEKMREIIKNIAEAVDYDSEIAFE